MTEKAKTQNRTEKFYSLRNDLMFHMVFQQSERALKGLVAALMGMDVRDIRECRIENPILPGKQIDEKSCVLDILLTLNNDQRLDIEMQVRKTAAWTERTMLYLLRAYDSLKSGESYRDLRTAVQIEITDFTLFEDDPAFYAEYKMRNTKSGRVFSDKLSIRVLDLTKTELAIQGRDDELKKWAAMFKADSFGELRQAAAGDAVFQEMEETMKKLSKDDNYTVLMDGRDRYFWDMHGSYDLGKEDGREEGIIEGMARGKAEGKAEGIEATIKQLAAAMGKDESELRAYLKKR